MFFVLFYSYHNSENSIKHLEGTDLIWYHTMLKSRENVGSDFFGFEISKRDPDFPGLVGHLIRPYKNTINTSNYILNFYDYSQIYNKQIPNSLENSDDNFDFEEFKRSILGIATVTLPIIIFFFVNTVLCLIRPFIQRKLELTRPNKCRRITYYTLVANGFLFLGFSIVFFIDGLYKFEKHISSITECTSAIFDFLKNSSPDLERAAAEFSFITKKAIQVISRASYQIDSFINSTFLAFFDPIQNLTDTMFGTDGFINLYNNQYYSTIQQIQLILDQYNETEELSQLLETNSLLSPSFNNLTSIVTDSHKILDEFGNFRQSFSNLNFTITMYVDKTNSSFTRPMTDIAYDKELLEELQNTITDYVTRTFSLYEKIIIILFSLVLISICAVQLIYLISPSFENQCCINYILYYDFASPLLFGIIMLGLGALFSMLSCILSFVSIHMETDGDKIISNLADCLVNRSITFPPINLTIYSNGLSEFIFDIPQQFIPYDLNILSKLVLSDPNSGVYDGMDLQKVVNLTQLGNYIADYLEETSQSFEFPQDAYDIIDSVLNNISSPEILPTNFEEFLSISESARDIRNEIKKYPNIYNKIGEQIENYLDDVEQDHSILSSLYSSMSHIIKNEFPNIIDKSIIDLVQLVKKVIHSFSVYFRVITPHVVAMVNQLSTGNVKELYAKFRNIILYNLPRDSSLLAVASYLGLFSVMLMELSLLFITISHSRTDTIDDQSLPPITDAVPVDNNKDIIPQIPAPYPYPINPEDDNLVDIK